MVCVCGLPIHQIPVSVCDVCPNIGSLQTHKPDKTQPACHYVFSIFRHCIFKCFQKLKRNPFLQLQILMKTPSHQILTISHLKHDRTKKGIAVEQNHLVHNHRLHGFKLFNGQHTVEVLRWGQQPRLPRTQYDPNTCTRTQYHILIKQPEFQ